VKILRIPLFVVLIIAAGQPFPARAQTVTILHFFAGTPTDGALPKDKLLWGSDGNLYGTTSSGGTNFSVTEVYPNFLTNYEGTVFRISPSGSFTDLYEFAGSDGANPYGGLVQGSDSNFYGTTSQGGTTGNGTVFRIDPSGTFTSLYSFGDAPDGSTPGGELAQGSDGYFYGTTRGGGTHNEGTVFRISPSGTYTSLYSFAGGSSDGAGAFGGLIQGSDSNFYGTTVLGGTYETGGTVYRISPSGVESIVYSFGAMPGDGAEPQCALVLGSDSNFYGTTFQGGTGYGTVFRISPSGTYTSLYAFGGSPVDGAGPLAGLVLGSDGNFYGTTFTGGTTNTNPYTGSSNNGPGYGTLFAISPSGTYTSLYFFTGSPGDGAVPSGALVEDNGGNVYGTTYIGGTSNTGTVFKFATGSGGGNGGTNCSYAISPTNAVYAAAGGSSTVSVTASNGCAWTAVSNDGFITITSGSSGSGHGTVHYTVAGNTNSTEQVGTMTIAGQTFTVTEAGAAGCSFTVSKTNITVMAKGGKGTISVKASAKDCSWTAVSNNSFITITAGANGTGSGKVSFVVPGNTNTTAIAGTITVAGQTVTIDQALGGCTFKLSPKDGKIKSTGGTFTVKVTPNLSDCDWSATTTDSFITIVSGSGTGKGSVSYTVPANATTNVLTGTITIGGQAFTVTQAGAK